MNATSMLAVNIGNAVTKIGLYYSDTLLAKWTVTTPETITTSEVQTILMNFEASLKYNKEVFKLSISPKDLSPKGSIIASVAPPITKAWVSALTLVCNRKPLVVGPGLKTGIKLGYSDPSELGADRIAEMVGARNLFGAPLIVVNLETTTTFEVINDKGEFVGGIIAPGLETSAKELANAAAKIPVVELKAPTKVIGKSTREAVQAGVVLGEVARIDGLVSYIWQELGYETKAVAAGADAKVIKVLSHTINETVDNLALYGLSVLYKRNAKN